MSSPFPKSKEKRPRSPSEPNKSFVKNVTSKVSGLLPATITKWFSSPSSSNTNGSAQAADATDSSTEDEAPESPTTIQPPTKKARYNPPGEFSQQVSVETRCTSTNTETIDEIYTAHSPLGRSNSGVKNIFASTLLHARNDDAPEETTEDSFYKPQHSISAIEQSMTKKRKSLFGTPEDDSSKKQCLSKSGNVRDPYFKPSLLSSPFYVGRTMYGGASSSYLSPSSFKKKTINVTNETSNNDSVNMSHSARRIMDLLEHYSSPLIEAKRIPQITRDPENHSIDNSLQQSVNPSSRKITYSYKTQELYVPSIANILTIKRNSRLMDTTNAARQIIASHSSSSDFLPYPETNSGGDSSEEVSGDKLTTKIKSRLTRTNRERIIGQKSIGSDTPEPITSEQSYTPTPCPKCSCSVTDKKLKINENIEVVKTKEDSLPANTNNQINIDNKLSIPKTSDWKCSSCWVMNKKEINKCICCGETKPGELDNDGKKCSTCNVSINQCQCNKCTEYENKSKNIEKPFVIKEANVKKWKCNDCWVDNDESVDKCVCCGEKNLNKVKSLAVINSEKVVESEWKCNDCWIKNKSSLTKCAACGGSKPDSQTSKYNNLGSSALAKDSQEANKGNDSLDSTFMKIAKSQSERWECPLCLVRNKSNTDTCICCEASKPGTEKESKKFNFHQPSEITFKFGIQLKNQEQSADTEPEECNMGEESETNNNILPKTTLTFGLPITKSEDQSLSIDRTVQVPKMNLTFGVPKDVTLTLTNNIFGMTNKPAENTKSIEEKPQEVPQVFTTPQSNEQPKTNIGLFSTPITSQVPDMPGLLPLQSMNQNSSFKKDISFLRPIIPTTTTEEKTQQNNFTFPKIMLTTNLFAAVPTTTTSPTNILPGSLAMNNPATTAVSLFQKLNTVTTTASSFFQKSDSVPTLGGSLFPKAELQISTMTRASGSMASMQPVFSFAGQGTAPQAEKPKFSFNFTNNKTDTTTMFKPTFGGTSDNNITSNKFNLSSNSIIGGSPPSGNQLNNATQLNPLATNSLTTPTGPSIFGATVPKENMWTPSTNNLFAANTTINGDPKPAFTFGTSTPFSASNAPFGSSSRPGQGSCLFGSTAQSPSNNPPFGSNAQLAQPNNNAPFGSTAQQAPSNNNTPFGSSAQQGQTNNTPFGSTAQQSQTNAAPFGGTAQQAQTNIAPFGSIAQQAQTNNAPFGSSTQQAQTNNVPFGSTAQAQTNNTPFGSTTQQTQPSATFGSITQQTQPNTATFGNTAQQPQPNAAFGSTTQQTQAKQQTQNVFGIASQTTTSQPSIFGNHLQSQTTPNMFGGLQVPNNPMPMGIFGAPNQVVTPSFGTLNPSIPTFEASAIPPPQPAPASFNFGGQPSTGIFGFGQQQHPAGQTPLQPETQPGMYGFGGPTGTAPQFTIGSAPNTNVRRVRKAMRRTQR